MKLPVELQTRLERTTAFKTKIEEAEKSHETRKFVMRDEAEQQIETIRKTNSRRIQELEAEINRFNIDHERMISAANSRAQIAQTTTRGQAEVQIAAARGEERVEKAKGEKVGEELIRSTEIECRKQRVEAEQRANTMVRQSEAKLDEARNLAQGLIAKAEAEFKGAEKLKERRRIELELQRLDVLRQLAGTGRRVIVGERARDIISVSWCAVSIRFDVSDFLLPMLAIFRILSLHSIAQHNSSSTSCQLMRRVFIFKSMFTITSEQGLTVYVECIVLGFFCGADR